MFHNNDAIARKLSSLLLLSTALFFFPACSENGGKENEDELQEALEKEKEREKKEADKEKSTDVQRLIRSAPSPIEMSSLIKESGADFRTSLTNSPDRTDRYVDNYLKALNLGIYGADLGYMNIYGETLASVSTISAVKELSQDLKVGRFFSFSTLERLASEKENVDSLIRITTTAFSDMDRYLAEQGREHISALIVTGTFVEGLYIASQVATQGDGTGEALVERVGEQKMVLRDIVKLLAAYKEKPKYGELHKDMKELQRIYEDVEISYSKKDGGGNKEKDGALVVGSRTESQVKVPEKTFEKIRAKVETVREALVDPGE